MFQEKISMEVKKGGNPIFTLSSDCHIFAFDKRNEPALAINSGDSVQIQTMDCFADQLKTAEDRLDSIDWNRINPATGPIYVEGAKAGDTLKVTVEKIEIGAQGAIATGEGFGLLGDEMTGMSGKLVAIRDGQVVFDDKVTLPVEAMIGVIGTAPADDPINCGTPGSHGGNMDNKMIRENAILYFPVFTDGALFALGDVHAAMGDGEIGVSGVEVPAVVTVKMEVIKDRTIANPYMENESLIATIASDVSIENAISTAVHDMKAILCDKLPLSLPETAMLFSAVGNVEICQVVDPLKTVRFTFPKWVLERYS